MVLQQKQWNENSMHPSGASELIKNVYETEGTIFIKHISTSGTLCGIFGSRVLVRKQVSQWSNKQKLKIEHVFNISILFPCSFWIPCNLTIKLFKLSC
jgi:hypothetical protein